jgi:uncharacterized membrane protein
VDACQWFVVSSLSPALFGGPGMYLGGLILLVAWIIAWVSQACIAGSRFVYSVSVLQSRTCEDPFKFHALVENI